MRDKIISKTMDVLQKTAGILMLLMVIVITIQLIARNLLKTSTPWTEDTAKLMLAWLTFLGAPVVLYRNEHLMVDLIYSRVSAKARKYINMFSNLVISVFCIFGIKLGIDLCTNKIVLNSTTAAAGIPRVYMYSALPVGCFIMLLVAANAFADNILVLMGKKEDTFRENVVDEDKTIDEIEAEE